MEDVQTLRLALFGGTGRVGQAVLERAVADGHQVHVLARHPANLATPAARITQGDVRDLEAVAEVVAGADAVISAIGGTSCRNPQVIEKGTTHICSAMEAAGVRRLVAIQGFHLEFPGDPHNPGRRMVACLMSVMAPALARDSNRMAALLRSSSLDWTLIRMPPVRRDDRLTPYSVGSLRLGPWNHVTTGQAADFALGLHRRHSKHRTGAHDRQWRAGPRIQEVQADVQRGARMTGTLTPDQLPEGWADGAANYETWFSPLTRRFCVNAVELLGLRPGDQLLDVAAGTGAMTFAALGAGAKVTAVDFAPGMVERLRARAKSEGIDVALDVMDGQCLEFADSTFDVTVSMFGLIFFPDLDAGARELVRVARPNGRILVGAWDATRFPLFLAVERAIERTIPGFTRPPGFPTPFRLGNASGLERLMTRAGCCDVSVLEVTHDWVLEEPVATFLSLPSWAAPLKVNFQLLGPGQLAQAADHFAEAVEEMCLTTGGLSFTSLFAYGRRPNDDN